MPKPISQRGFEVDKKLKDGRMKYEINGEGGEEINIYSGENFIEIAYMDGGLYRLIVNTPQISNLIMMLDGEMVTSSSEGRLEENLRQAEEIYNEVKEILKVEEKLKEYIPKFSHVTEITLYNVLNIEGARDLSSLLEEKKELGDK